MQFILHFTTLHCTALQWTNICGIIFTKNLHRDLSIKSPRVEWVAETCKPRPPLKTFLVYKLFLSCFLLQMPFERKRIPKLLWGYLSISLNCLGRLDYGLLMTNVLEPAICPKSFISTSTSTSSYFSFWLWKLKVHMQKKNWYDVVVDYLKKEKF